MKKIKLNAVIKLGADDRWHDISTKKIWAKRIDSDTDTRFWIAFSASELKVGEVKKFVADQITKARAERKVFDRSADKYKSAVLDRKITILKNKGLLDAALTRISDELDSIEGSALMAEWASEESEGLKPRTVPQWLEEGAKNTETLTWPSIPKLPPKPKLITLQKRGKVFGKSKGTQNERTERMMQEAKRIYREVASIGNGYDYPSHASRCNVVAERLIKAGDVISGKRLQAILRPLYRKRQGKRG